MDIEEFIESIPGIDFLSGVYVIVRALVIAIDVMLLFGFLYALKKAIKFRPHFNMSRNPRKIASTLRSAYYKTRWAKLLEKYTATPTPDSLRLAIIEADAMVDQVLKDMKFPGDHLADRLSALNNREVKTLDGVWDAHRLRNDIVHSPHRQVSVREAMNALDKYERFFKELKIFASEKH